MFFCVLGVNKEFHHISLPTSAAHICSQLLLWVHHVVQMVLGWLTPGMFPIRVLLYLPTSAGASQTNCTFTLLQLLLLREPSRSAAAWYSLRQRLSRLLISLSLLSAHITSFYSLLSSIFLHVTAARSLLLPDFHYTVLTLFQLRYLISASHSEDQIYSIFFFLSLYNLND